MCVCDAGLIFPMCGDVCDGYVPQCEPRHLHVQHVVCLQVSICLSLSLSHVCAHVCERVYVLQNMISC